ncbi:hypothetical protein HaLaN_29919 [Haematococcus lacustris]|uniref:Uncharacterized protein n=1 Tax=Haematococcus lacustris TaxID=44745 RepID=A0A6A0AEB3_HAELA|nr:hypothetical protein HaLaN_29919 [Haematococcus lacustris]
MNERARLGWSHRWQRCLPVVMDEGMHARDMACMHFEMWYLNMSQASLGMKMWLTPLKPSAVRLLGRPPPLGVRDFL